MTGAARLTILGSGTSAGVPVIGCECEVCVSPDPRDRRTRSSALIETIDAKGQPRSILIDTSPDLREQALRARMKRLDAILFTHHHVDHTFGLDDVRRFNAVMNAPIDIYAEPHTMENLVRVYRHIFERHKNVNPSFVADLIPLALQADVPLELFGLRITPLRLMHGRLPILGFRIDRTPARGSTKGHGASWEGPAANDYPLKADDLLPMAYCTDVSSIPPETWPRMQGLKTLILDALRYRAHPTHFTVDEAIATAQRLDAEQTYLIHMTHDISHADLESRLPDRIALTYDGLVIGALD